MTTVIPDYLGATARQIGLKKYPDVRQFVVQHLYPDTLRLLLLLHKYVPIDCVIGIGYSGSSLVVDQLREARIRVLTPEYADLATVVKAELGDSLARCSDNQQRLMLHEVGGYAIKCLHQDYVDQCHAVVGAIEVTKQGVWMAQSLPALKIPQLNCAETRLKEIEGKLVGESVVAAFDNIVRDLGMALTGRQAILIGYGWVGKGAAHSLATRGVRLTVKDNDNIKLVNAVVDGFGIARSDESPCEPAVVIGVTGQQGIGKEIIDHLPDKCFLVSGSSKDHEIDLEYLASIALTVMPIHKHVEVYNLENGRCVFLVNKGYPVNFTSSSVPDEIVEFLFSELIMLVPELLDKEHEPGTYPLSPEREAVAAQIWLDLR